MGNQEERLDKILHELKRENAAAIRDLAAKLKVSEMTVRRDLSKLAQENLITVMHGGAVLNQENYFENFEKRYLLAAEGSKRRLEKEKIGKTAASLIQHEEIVLIDSGSTTEWIAKNLPLHFDIHAVCYALNILIECYARENVKITFAGGELHRNTLVFENETEQNLISQYRVNKAFFSASGIHPELGVTSSNTYERQIKQTAMASSLTKILCADSSKFGKVSAAYYSDLRGFDLLITDEQITPVDRKIVENAGVKLIVAESPS